MPSNDSVNAGQHSALKVAGSVFLGIAGFLALIFLLALWISGVLWVSEKIVGYVWIAADTAFWVCLIVLLPLSLFRATRKISCFGFLGASFSFGLCTWILGSLTTYEYWGGLGVFVGLVLGAVGTVPLGILASIFHADWTSAIFLTIGLVLTYGARSFAMWLAIKTDQEDSVVAARVDTVSARDRVTQSGSAVASVSLLPEDYEFENDTPQDAVQDSEQAQRSDSEVATGYYPDLDAIYADLRRVSPNLALAFRATLLETKQFARRKELAQRLEEDFFRTYFGRNPKILEFARALVARGQKAAAKELNRAISVLGKGADERPIIARIEKKFVANNLAPAERESAREIAKTLVQTHYVSDAVTLVAKLGGTVTYKRGGVLFLGHKIIVAVLGEYCQFKSEYDLAQWVINMIVPKVLTT